MKKALVFISDGSEEIEAITPLDYLRRAGVQLTLAAAGTWSMEGERPLVKCSHGLEVLAESSVDALGPDAADEFDAVVVPGGMPGSAKFADDERLISLLDAFEEKGKLVCAICAAPALVLSRTKALCGKKWTCYPGMADQAAAFADSYEDGKPFVHDANVITGRGPGAAEEFAMEIVKTLCGEEVAGKIKAGAVQR